MSGDDGTPECIFPETASGLRWRTILLLLTPLRVSWAFICVWLPHGWAYRQNLSFPVKPPLGCVSEHFFCFWLPHGWDRAVISLSQVESNVACSKLGSAKYYWVPSSHSFWGFYFFPYVEYDIVFSNLVKLDVKNLWELRTSEHYLWIIEWVSVLFRCGQW